MTTITRTSWHAVSPRTGEPTGPAYVDASPEQIDDAVAAARSAARALARSEPEARARALRVIAERLEAVSQRLIEVADEETALGTARLSGELERTTGQLRRFADLAADSSWTSVVIDRTVGTRTGLRRTHVPLGPVAVFTASNFPFAFSVAGGDTASALAVGAPVVVKAHSAHPTTSELAAEQVQFAIADAGLPAGSFGMVHGSHNRVGAGLVLHPEIEAVAFTGSVRGGRALADLASTRPRPIPVYAEMGSLNPVVVTAAAARARCDEITTALADSFTLGTGQFCTKPGIVLVPETHAQALAAGLAGAAADREGHLLTPGMAATLREQLRRDAELSGVELVLAPRDEAGTQTQTPAVLRVDFATFVDQRDALLEEHFGPAIVVVGVEDAVGLEGAVDVLPGSLTGTLFAQPEDAGDVLVARLSEVAGRVLVDGVPTGVAVSPAQVHTGPYPASTFGAHTAVGDEAFRRFVRPVAYQDVPEDWLPPPVRSANPWGVEQRIVG